MPSMTALHELSKVVNQILSLNADRPCALVCGGRDGRCDHCYSDSGACMIIVWILIITVLGGLLAWLWGRWMALLGSVH